MAFQQGLSGLATSSRAIDVTSNNIANTNTVGFKAGSAQFADVFASALTGAVSSIAVGIGSTVNSVKQAFTQGNLTSTNNPLDMGINGNGFFRIERNDGTFAYTRNGQFDVDNQGYIVNAQGERLSGNQVDPTSGAIGNVIGPIQIPQSEAPPRATGIDATGTGKGVEILGNLDSRQAPPPNAPFNALDIDSYNSTTSLTVYDSQGNPHTLSLYFVRNAAPNQWTVHGSLNGDAPTPIVADLTFSTTGEYESGTFGNFNRDLRPDSEILNFPVDLSDMTQFGSPFSITDIQQDGFNSGQVAGFAISREGVIQGRYTNGQTRDLGQIALYTFRSPNGLTSLGNNLWASSPESGPPVSGKPGVGLNGVISAGMVEDANVDLTQELVQLIIQQRNYQANAQSIRTQDQILQTLVNLR